MKVLFDVWYRCSISKKRWNPMTKKLYKKESGFSDRCCNYYFLMTYRRLFNFLIKNHMTTIEDFGDVNRDTFTEKTMDLLFGVKEVVFKDYFDWLGAYKTIKVRIHGVDKP